MSNLPRGPAIRRAESGRPDLLVFEVTAKIHRADIEAMAHAVDAAMETPTKIDILLVFTVFDGATLSAMFDGDAAQVSLRSNANVRRYAVVGAPAFAEAMIKIFDPLSPVDARTFDLEHLDEARAWIDSSVA